MRQNRQGFTLIEVMLALVIILIAMLGLYKSVSVSIDSNLANHLRDEAVKIGTEVVEEIRSIPFQNVPVTGTNSYWSDSQFYSVLGYSPTVTRSIRNISKKYTVKVSVNSYGNTFKEVTVVVGWNVKNKLPPKAVTGREYEFRTTTMLGSGT